MWKTPAVKEMLFSIGGHPDRFNVPDLKPDEPLHGTLKFDNKGNIERIFGNVGGCILSRPLSVETNEGVWDFDEDSFKDDAIIIDKCQIHEYPSWITITNR